MQPKILLIDDESSVRRVLRVYLERQGFQVLEASTIHLAEAAFETERPDAVVLDYQLPGGDSLDLLPRLRETEPGVPVVMLTGHGSIDLAVRAIKEGAESFLTKPVDLEVLSTILRRALESRRTQRRDVANRRGAGEKGGLDPFIGTSPAIRALRAEAELAVLSDSPVLILGETGCGKGVLARWLHGNGTRSNEAFVDLNCAGLSRELLESELFGHAKGAFTGAVSDKHGLLEVADRGTLLLDELGDMDLAIQPKLLKVLEEKRFRRLGDVEERRVDVRLLAATHHDLADRVREKEFRADLYFRINTLVLRLPPLRERRADLPAIAAAILDRLATEMARPPQTLTEEALASLEAYSWPGNLRELRNVLERAVLVARNEELDPEDLRFERTVDPVAGGELYLTLEEMERRHIERVLADEKGQVSQCARRLGVPRSTLYEKLRAYQIVPSAFRDGEG